VAAQGVSRLVELDRWYRNELPPLLASRTPLPHVTHTELGLLTEWKMARGVWRAPNLALVRSNDPDVVARTSAVALARTPQPTEPLRELATLKGVGPATASAVVAAWRPDVYPFFDELVATQIPHLPEVQWTLPFFARYADAIRARAAKLGGDWTPVMVERALWAYAGGKKGAML
jgi:hypothetical protein